MYTCPHRKLKMPAGSLNDVTGIPDADLYIHIDVDPLHKSDVDIIDQLPPKN